MVFHPIKTELIRWAFGLAGPKDALADKLCRRAGAASALHRERLLGGRLLRGWAGSPPAYGAGNLDGGPIGYHNLGHQDPKNLIPHLHYPVQPPGKPSQPPALLPSTRA